MYCQQSICTSLLHELTRWGERSCWLDHGGVKESKLAILGDVGGRNMNYELNTIIRLNLSCCYPLVDITHEGIDISGVVCELNEGGWKLIQLEIDIL